MNTALEKVKELLQNEKAGEARTLFENIAPVETVEYLMVKGELEQKFQQWGNAYNSFSKVLEKDPSDVKAKANVELIKGILNFFNPDQLNP